MGAGGSTLNNIVQDFVDSEIDLPINKGDTYSDTVEALLKATHEYTTVLTGFVKCYLSSSKVKSDSRF